jgi:hypothetical protein
MLLIFGRQDSLKHAPLPSYAQGLNLGQLCMRYKNEGNQDER